MLVDFHYEFEEPDTNNNDLKSGNAGTKTNSQRSFPFHNSTPTETCNQVDMLILVNLYHLHVFVVRR